MLFGFVTYNTGQLQASLYSTTMKKKTPFVGKKICENKNFQGEKIEEKKLIMSTM